MREYVVGFMFSPGRHNVVLIKKKTGPKCVVGKWNGVGGKVNPNEHPRAAMSREFLEETGVYTEPAQWEDFCRLVGEGFIVHFYSAVSEEYCRVQTTTPEEVRIFPCQAIGMMDPKDREGVHKVVENLTWMIPFLRDQTTHFELGAIRVLLTDEE